MLGLEATNNFVGKNLFDSTSNRKVISFRNANGVMRNDSLAVFVQANNRKFSHARIQSKVIDWDTTETVGGFIAEKKSDVNVTAQADSLLDAMDAWIWVLDNNLLQP